VTTFCGHYGKIMDISAAQFKAECLKLMDLVEKTREPIVITKHGRPVAQLAPVPADDDSLFGYMKNTIKIEGDVLAPVGEEWSALSGDEDHLYSKRSTKPARKK
jgi:prevent-host-death family protein